MKPLSRLLLSLVALAVCLPVNDALAQKDTVFLIKKENQRGSSKVTGKVIGSTPDSITVQDGGQSREVPTHTIRKIVYADEPSALERARDRITDGRYADCLTELAKIKKTPPSTFIQREIEYLNAFANANIALAGGDVTAQVAGQAINKFINDNPDAYQTYPAVDLMGKLLLGIGRVNLAEKQFDKLSQAQSPIYKSQGFFQKGNSQLLQEKLDEAKSTFNEIEQINSNDETTRQFKLAAKCQLAKIKALQGDPASAKSEIEAIIKSESEENEMVFAYAYNALGTCHEKLGDLKSAALAFLHNDLLFMSQADARAEALYKLAKIWPQLDKPDAANRARSSLLSQYQNSIWASKL